MPKYRVIGILNADTSVDVEADTAEDAADTSSLSTPNLCYQCSHIVQLGDIVSVQVMNENGNIVYDSIDLSVVEND